MKTEPQSLASALGFVVDARRTRPARTNRTAMSMSSKTLLMIFLLAGIPYVVAGQNAIEVYEVTGTGWFQGQSATINGRRRASESYNAMGDARVQFVGTLRSPLGQAELRYEGDTESGSYPGYLNVQGNIYNVDILDNTDGKFLIWDGTPTLHAANTLGEFVCQWRRVQ